MVPQKYLAWLIFFIDVWISIHFHTIKSRLKKKTNNFEVILASILDQIYRQKDGVEENSRDIYVRIDSQKILIEVYAGGAVQENSILHRMHTSLP